MASSQSGKSLLLMPGRHRPLERHTGGCVRERGCYVTLGPWELQGEGVFVVASLYHGESPP
jgi:hypothetical protein